MGQFIVCFRYFKNYCEFKSVQFVVVHRMKLDKAVRLGTKDGKG